MYATQKRRSQTPISQIIDDYASITSESEPAQARSAPQSYQLVNIHQPGGSSTTIRRNLSTRETGEGRKVVAFTSPPTAATGACRTVLARSSDGSFRRVQRPVRDSELFMRPQPRSSEREPAPRSVSVRSSSIYDEDDDDASRGTMISTMTLVETALAEQQTYQRSRGIQIPACGHSASGSSATGASGTSANIEIGHIDENEEHERSRRYSTSDYGDVGDHTAEFERDNHSIVHRSRSGKPTSWSSVKADVNRVQRTKATTPRMPGLLSGTLGQLPMDCCLAHCLQCDIRMTAARPPDTRTSYETKQGMHICPLRQRRLL